MHSRQVGGYIHRGNDQKGEPLGIKKSDDSKVPAKPYKNSKFHVQLEMGLS